MRHKVSHAASHRGLADPVVVAVELSDGTIGYGETLPRSYVTCETVDSVVDAIRNTFVTALVEFHPATFAESLESIEGLPWQDGSGRSIPAARAAVELALLDATMRCYGRDIEDVVGWLGLPGFGKPASIGRIRFSGVLATDDPQQTLRQLRLMYWGGLRHFKLKVGSPGDFHKLQRVIDYLARPIAKGKVRVRLDANGAWVKDDAIEWLARAAELPVEAIEQPLSRGDEADLGAVRDAVGGSGLRFVHDESLITRDDADRLIKLGVADGFNIRISKCGGLLPSLRLGGIARRAGVDIQLGCMVGETSILSAAALRFLQVCPDVVWAEGCFGSWLLGGDVVRKPLRFGYGGRPPRLRGAGLGVDVRPERLRSFCEDKPIVLNL
ncbi:MAG: hypothetical protein IIB61_08720 [Planctomycetes bacterium]|nr:hypothetical protein [Planctomycetota bacterium]